jgi:hypothetical protein
MRKLIVSNFVTLDGYYEGPDKSLNGLFDHHYEAYSGDQSFDHYNAERLRSADLLLLSRSAPLSNSPAHKSDHGPEKFPMKPY